MNHMHFQSALSRFITVAIYTTLMNDAAQSPSTTTNTPHSKYSTIIMGAGMSGVSAAKKLYDAGETNFIVLEAQDYIGGRTKTVEFGGLSGLNIGGSWFTGGCENSTPENCAHWGIVPTETNPLLAIGKAHGFTFVNTKWADLIALGANGKDETSNYNAAEAKLDTVWECIYNMSTANISLSDAYQQCGWNPTDSASKSAQWVWFAWANAINADLIQPDLLEPSKELYGSQDLFITDSRGYQGITEIVANDFMDKIRLNAPIKTIAYDANNGVTVTLDSGETLSSYYGIITFSLGVLQSDLVTFSPPVPTWKSNAWNKFGMAHFSPILIKWPHDFWSATAGNKWWYILNDDRFGYYVNVMNLDHDDLFKDSLIWRIDLVSDVSVRVQKQDIAQIKADIVTKLSVYFNNVPQPQEIIIQKWSENKYIRGCYMYWPPKTTVEDQDEMRRNLDGVLYFAGEHLLADSGYVHTAYLSGISAADEVLQSMRTSTTTTTTNSPTQNPTSRPTQDPTHNPIQRGSPTAAPVLVTSSHTGKPTHHPTKKPTNNPIRPRLPTAGPTAGTLSPTKKRINNPIRSRLPTAGPTAPVTLSETSDATLNTNANDKRETSPMVEGQMVSWIVFAVIGIILCCCCVGCAWFLYKKWKYKQQFDEVTTEDMCNPDDEW